MEMVVDERGEVDGIRRSASKVLNSADTSPRPLALPSEENPKVRDPGRFVQRRIGALS